MGCKVCQVRADLDRGKREAFGIVEYLELSYVPWVCDDAYEELREERDEKLFVSEIRYLALASA